MVFPKNPGTEQFVLDRSLLVSSVLCPSSLTSAVSWGRGVGKLQGGVFTFVILNVTFRQGGCGLQYKGVICCCLSCVAERMLFVETELLSSKAIKCFHLFKHQPALANELCCMFVCLFAVILILVVFPQFIFK